jgi:hypothetical protein
MGSSEYEVQAGYDAEYVLHTKCSARLKPTRIERSRHGGKRLLQGDVGRGIGLESEARIYEEGC